MEQFRDMFSKLKGGGGGKGGGAPGGGGDDAARKAIQDSFNNPKKYDRFFGGDSKPSDSGRGGGSGGEGSGGGGGWGGGKGDGAASAGDDGSEKPISQELLEAFKYSWTVFWNLALFLGFARVLHKSLDWCCQVELLLLVGAPQQAFERISANFFAAIEWVEKNVLGWDIPGDEDMMPMHQNLALYYPDAHAYTFDQYKFPMTEAEKQKLKHMHALRHYERANGHRDDVDPAEVDAIKARYDPVSADRDAWKRAKAQGRVEDYWAAHKEDYAKATGRAFTRPPGTRAPAAAAAAAAPAARPAVKPAAAVAAAKS